MAGEHGSDDRSLVVWQPVLHEDVRQLGLNVAPTLRNPFALLGYLDERERPLAPARTVLAHRGTEGPDKCGGDPGYKRQEPIVKCPAYGARYRECAYQAILRDERRCSYVDEEACRTTLRLNTSPDARAIETHCSKLETGRFVR
jgi:hypothetical protein